MRKRATKKSAFLASFAALMGSLASYIGFYDRITCRPTQAGFWYIIILGFTLGIMVTLFALWMDERKAKKKVTEDNNTTVQEVR